MTKYVNRYYRKMKRQSKILTTHMTEGFVFLRRFLDSPRQIGSITPSSAFLTRSIMDKIEWDATSNLAELGAGTGVFTRAVVRKMNAGTNFMVFEIDDRLKEMIKREHKNLQVYGDARDLPQIMQSRGISRLDCVISSIPWTVLPEPISRAILDAVDDCLKPDGKLIAYQYSTHMKHTFEQRFESVKISFVLRNIPPAFVYVCTGPKGKKRPRGGN